MDGMLWTIFIVVTGLAELLLALAFIPNFMANRTRAFSESIGIRLVPELQQLVTRRLSRRYIGFAIGANLGIFAGALFLFRQSASDDVFVSWLTLIGTALAGLSLGAAISSATVRQPRDPDSVKYARVREVTLNDYVPPLERWLARGGVGLSVIAAGVALALGAAVALPAVLTLIGVASLLFFEIAGRRIVAHPQQAASPRELGWDDALRASVLRDMAIAPLALGLYSLVLTLVALVGSVQPTLIIFVLATAAISVASARTLPQRHFLRRLWADPA